MVIGEAITAITLFKTAVDGIKSALNTANDVSDIAQQLDDLFRAEDEVQKARNKKAGFENFSTESVAQEVIDSKLAKEKMVEIAMLVNMRFGPNTWSEILALRQQKIRKQRELIKMQKKERLQKQMQIQETLKQVGLAVAIAVGVVVCVVVGFITMARGSEA